MVVDRQFLARVKRDVFFGHDIEPPFVNAEKCNGCGHCVRVCSARVFELKDRKSQVVRGEGCFACGHCWAVCPEEAVVQGEAATDTSLRPGKVPAVPPDTLQLLIRERRSTRLFKDEPVSREQLLKIVEAGRYTPSAGNRQAVSYVVLSDPHKVAELRRMVESFWEMMFRVVEIRAIRPLLKLKFGGPAVDMVRYYGVGYQVSRGNKEERAYFLLPFGTAVIVAHSDSSDLMAQFNCAAALYGCSLMAHSLGLGSCFVGLVQAGANMDKKTKRWLGIPKDHLAGGAMVVGHPDVRFRRLVERREPSITWH